MDTKEQLLLVYHLSQRPYRAIFEKSTEQDSLTALKLMIVIDFHATQSNFYSRIDATGLPKLLSQLMQFHTYKNFKYYDYNIGRKIDDRILQCKFCELVGPYGHILTHMAIAHNAHIGLKMCAYCNRTELRMHFKCDEQYKNTKMRSSLQNCYDQYIQKHAIIWNDRVSQIVADFHEMLKKLSQALGVLTTRNHGYAGTGFHHKEKIEPNYGKDFPKECTVYRHRNPKGDREISCSSLDTEFHRIIGILYGGNRTSRIERHINNNIVKDSSVVDLTDDVGSHQSSSVRPAQSTTDATFTLDRTTDCHVENVKAVNLVKREGETNHADTSTAHTFVDDDDGGASTSTLNDSTQKGDCEIIGAFVAREIRQLPPGIKRRKLEADIQELILKAKIDSLKEETDEYVSK